MNPARLLPVFVLTFVGAWSSYAAEGSPTAFAQTIRPLLDSACAKCHGEKKQKGSIDFTSVPDLAAAMKKHKLWRKVAEQVQSGDMPPDDEPPLTADQKRDLLAWIDHTFDTSKSPDPGPPLVRQLTRAEYNNTMRDLFGITNFDPARAGGLREEEVVEGYANAAEAMTLNESTLEKYFAAADATLKYFFEDPRNDKARKAFFTPTRGGGFMVQEVLEHFMKRAFRRPVEKEEVDRLMPIVNAALKSGDPFETAMRKAIKPVLVSPYFLTRVEHTPDTAAPQRVSNHELATRLSYFLWSTMPDDMLMVYANAGKLSDPQVLEAQVRRMLADPKAATLTENFAMQWLHLNQFRRALPSRNNFPAFTPNLKNAMEAETRTFLDHLRTDDGSILDLLDCDYTYVNGELAKHYGLKGLSGDKMQRVSLKPEDHRGGLLGTAMMLTQTSHTDRTKPTARGKWILEVLLGTPPPPPPANVSNFKPPAKGTVEPKSFREKLAQHATDATCAACHAKIDPLGFALENYDAIGTWRESVGGAPVDNAGKLPVGPEFRGVDGLKKILHEKQALFERNLAEQMLTYALGRPVDYYDEPALQKITAALQANGHHYSTLVLEIVKSFPFQYRRGQGMVTKE